MGMNNSSKAHALWHLTRELLELGVEMSLIQEKFDPFEYHKYSFYDILNLFNSANKI